MYKIICSDKSKIQFLSRLIKDSEPGFIFKNFYFFDSLTSTQDFAMDLLLQTTEIEPTVILSDVQTGGKGRKGSLWVSPKGGIWISLLFEPDLENDQLFLIVVMTSLLLCELIQSFTELRPEIKWPNDIIINRKKVAGLLMDTQMQSGNKTRIILGLGLNVNNDPFETKSQIQSIGPTSNYEITSLKHENLEKNINVKTFISTFLVDYSDRLPRLSSMLYRNEMLNKYRRIVEESSKDQQFMFTSNDLKFKGEIVRVNDDGSILVRKLDGKSINSLIRLDSVFSIY